MSVAWSWGTKWGGYEVRKTGRGEGNLQAVFPYARLEGFSSRVLEGADAVPVEVAAVKGVLVAPCFVQKAWLEEADETSVGSVPPLGRLVGLVEVLPVEAGFDVLFVVCQ